MIDNDDEMMHDVNNKDDCQCLSEKEKQLNGELFAHI